MSTGPLNPRVPPASQVFPDEEHRRAAAAAEAGDVAQLRALAGAPGAPIQGTVDLDAAAPDDVNLLMYEIAAWNETGVLALLDAGADPNALTPKGGSPMLVAGMSEDPRWLTLLLDRGGDPNLKNSVGEPLLTLLVPQGRWANMELLLDRGARIDETGPSGQTATARLGALHQFDRVTVMLDRGADPEHADVNGLTLRDFVAQRVPPGSPQEPFRERVAQRIGAP